MLLLLSQQKLFGIQKSIYGLGFDCIDVLMTGNRKAYALIHLNYIADHYDISAVLLTCICPFVSVGDVPAMSGDAPLRYGSPLSWPLVPPLADDDDDSVELPSTVDVKAIWVSGNQVGCWAIEFRL